MLSAIKPLSGLSRLCQAASTGVISRTFVSSSRLFDDENPAKPESLPDVHPTYFDFQATTPLDPRVLDKMMPFLTNQYGNPHSRTHAFGWEAEKAVEQAREQVSSLIGADAKEIVFTSGATESNNMAIKGVAHFYQKKKNHIITTATEHKCVLDSCRKLQLEGFDVTYLPVKSNGIIDMKELENAIRPETALVSIMTVNNEIGVIQPIKDIGAMCKEKKTFFHTDAAQGVGKIPMDVNDMNIDLMSISGHKIYGPKGVGALYVRRRPRVRLEPLISGGGQERGMRSGTLAPFLVVGLGEACRLCQVDYEKDYDHIKSLSDRMYNRIMERIPDVYLNGDKEHRYPGNLNLSFAYVEGEDQRALQVGLSYEEKMTRSASLEPSYVLRALGVGEDLAHTSLRIGIGRFTTESEVDALADALVFHVERLRELSPLYEMVKEGIDLASIEWSQH